MLPEIFSFPCMNACVRNQQVNIIIAITFHVTTISQILASISMYCSTCKCLTTVVVNSIIKNSSVDNKLYTFYTEPIREDLVRSTVYNIMPDLPV